MERKGGFKKYDIVLGLLNPKDETSGRQGILLELIGKTTGVALKSDEKLNEIWTLYDIGTTVVDPKDRTDEQKEIIRRLRKLSLKK